jgi:hypothetical protein
LTALAPGNTGSDLGSVAASGLAEEMTQQRLASYSRPDR